MDTGDHPDWKSVAIILGKELEAKLCMIGSEEPEGVVRSLKSLQVCKEVTERLKGQVLAFGFESKEDEICFFKELKPKFQSKLIYFHRLFVLETGTQKGGRKELRAYWQKEINDLNGFLKSTRSFRSITGRRRPT